MFAMGEVGSDMRSLQIQQAVQGSMLSNPQQASPILFYPDGTTSDARLILTNEQQRYVVVKLRSLTGIARVSQLLSHDQLQQNP